MDLMNRVCKLYLDKFVIAFIDDILIYSKSKEDHELEEVRFLGHVINNNDIHVDSSNIEAMKNWKVLKTPSEIRSSLGLAVYYDTSNQGLRYVLMQRGKNELNMRQQRWIELFSDYDCEIRYHPGKENIVAAAFSEASKVRNVTKEMLRGLDQQMEKKEDGGLYFIDRGWDSINRSPILWAKIRESQLIGPELVQETIEKGGVVCFGKKGKLAPRYVRPFEILEGIGYVAYRLRLPQELSGVHDTFHVSNMKKCLADANLHVPLGEVKINKTLRFVEEPVVIMDCEVKKLKRSRIPIVKVRWNSKRGPEFTCERYNFMKAKYLNLVVDRVDESTRGYYENRDLARQKDRALFVIEHSLADEELVREGNAQVKIGLTWKDTQ
ncbi:hypothetical protein Tco_0689615 [Tanacetum coccineum]